MGKVITLNDTENKGIIKKLGRKIIAFKTKHGKKKIMSIDVAFREAGIDDVRPVEWIPIKDDYGGY